MKLRSAKALLVKSIRANSQHGIDASYYNWPLLAAVPDEACQELSLLEAYLEQMEYQQCPVYVPLSRIVTALPIRIKKGRAVVEIGHWLEVYPTQRAAEQAVQTGKRDAPVIICYTVTLPKATIETLRSEGTNMVLPSLGLRNPRAPHRLLAAATN